MESLPTLRDVLWLLHNVGALPAALIAYFPRGRLELTSPALLFSGDDLRPDEDVPVEAEHRGLRRSLGIPAVQDVLQNLELQAAGAGTDIQLQALNYYLDHDAFISL